MGRTAVATVVGRVSFDPSVVVTKSGAKIARILVGWSNKDRDGEVKWSNIEVSFFGKNADTVEQYVGKGSEVFVSGDLTQDNFTDKEGNQRSKLTILGSTLTLMGKPTGNEAEKKTESRPAKPAAKPSKPAAQEDDFPDEVPF